MHVSNVLFIFSDAPKTPTESTKSVGTELPPLQIPEGIPSHTNLVNNNINAVQTSGESFIQGTPQEYKQKTRGKHNYGK